MAGVSRRAPFPYDLKLGSFGYMLGAEKPGEPIMAGSKPQDQAAVVPTDFGPSAQSPLLERVQIYDDLSLGMGQKIQNASRTRGYRYLIGADQRYRYALGADMSVARIWQKGPSITTITPATVDATNGISDFFEIGGHIYALNGRYCLYRTDDTAWGVSKDFTAGKVSRYAKVYNAASVGTTFAYVAMGDVDAIYKFDGATTTTTWTQSVEALYARDFAIVGREFWRACESSANTVAKCDISADPFVLGNYNNTWSYTVGDASSAIQRLGLVGASLLIFKTDGIYTLDTSGYDHNLYPYLRSSTDTDNGKYIAGFGNDLYCSYRDGCYRIHPDFTIEEIGPERLTDNDSPVKGVITAMASDSFNLYAGIYNQDTGNSYLMKFGAWVSPQDSAASRVDVWNGSISAAFATKKITALYRASAGNHGADSGHCRMFLGFSDGTVGWFQLPCVSNPSNCSKYLFTTADATVDLPVATMGFASDPKLIKAVSVSGPSIDGNNYVQINYSTTPGGSLINLVDSSNAVVSFNQGPYQKEAMPDATSTTLLTVQVVLKSVATSASPILNFVGIHYADRPPLQLVWDFLVLADTQMARRDGTIYRLGAKAIRDNLESMAGNAAGVVATLPDESTQTLMVVGYQETQAWSERTRSWHAALKVQAAQALPAVLTYAAGTYGALAKYTYGQLSADTYAALAVQA